MYSESDLQSAIEAGAISAKPDAKVTVTPLVFTSGQSQLLDADKFKDKPDFFGILRDFQPGGTPLVLAARVAGDVPTAFPDGPPKEEAKDDADKKDDAKKAEAPKPLRSEEHTSELQSH